MALKKSVEVNKSGFFAEYFRIETIKSFNYFEGGKSITVTLALFKDKESRDSNKNPVSYITVNITDEVAVDALLTSTYKELKNNKELEGALDV
jgi:hypothetical protein